MNINRRIVKWKKGPAAKVPLRLTSYKDEYFESGSLFVGVINSVDLWSRSVWSDRIKPAQVINCLARS